MSQYYDLNNTGPQVQDRLDQTQENKQDIATLEEKVTAIENEIGESGQGGNTINARLDALETAVGSGGSVDERIAAAETEIIGGASSDYNTLGKVEGELEDTYRKNETYSKTELDNLITTPNVLYVTVIATSGTTDVTTLLPATGAADTVYRVGNWDGTQYDTTMYALYAWNGSAYVCLSVRSFVGEVYDVSVNHPDGQGNPTPYADLTAALGTGGANIPADIRRGGMSIKFIQGTVQSSDNKYIQARCMAQNFTTDTTQWQGVDDEPIVGSKNLITSGGVLTKMLPAFKTINLYDGTIIDGYYINNSGGIWAAPGWAMTTQIEVTAGEKYTISCDVVGRSVGLNWYDALGNVILAETTIYTTHTAPANAVSMQFNIANYGVYSTNVMVVHGEEVLPYVPNIQTQTQYIAGLQEFVKDVIDSEIGGGGLTITKEGNTISVTDGTNTIEAKIENNSGNIYGANPVFNFTSLSFGGLSHGNSDDIAPMHILNVTLGGNHGQPCVIATITNHGLDNTSIGTAWAQNNKTFYIMRIVNSNQIVLLSGNTGTSADPTYVYPSTGTITNGTDTLTISALSEHQLWPGLKNHTIRLVVDGKSAITSDGTYYGNTLDVVEEYDIMNPDSTLQKIIARAGQSGEPVFDGDSAMCVRNIYRFDKTMSVLVIATVIPQQTIKFANIMFAQANIIADNTTKYYIPNSLPLGGGDYDFRAPLAVNWSSSIPALTVGAEQMADVENPVNRVIQYYDNKKVGFALGFIKGLGVGKDLLDYTGETFEIRNSTGKIYPHGVSSAKIGSMIQSGTAYQAVMYRSPFKYELTGNRMSMYHFELDGSEYVFVDYRATTTDNVIVSDLLNGKKIEVIESVNTELLTDIYNNGFIVKATYVANETCFIVVKIH